MSQPDTSSESVTGGDPASSTSSGADPVVAEVVPEAERILRGELELARSEAEAAKARAREVESNLRAVSKKYRELEEEMGDFRRRMQQNADVRVERKVHELVGIFFDPVMNLKRALAMSSGDAASVIDGVKMVSSQFSDALAKIGLQEIPGAGSAFDPSIHEALAVMPVTDAALDGKVLEVYSVGYRVGSTVLQPAQVVIGKFETPAEA